MTIRPVRVNRGALAVLALTALVVRAYPLTAQLPAPTTLPVQTPQQTTLAPYRAPVIALVQPAVGGSVTADKPVVVFRFAQGELSDPLDAASFTVAVDGVDRTALFQVAAAEAWGPLAASTEVAVALQPGLHQVAARICSSRGACGTVASPVTVLPAPATSVPGAPQQAGSPSKKKRLFDALLAAGKTLLAH